MKKIELICIGENKFKELKEIEKKYLQKINYFVEFSVKKLSAIKIGEERQLRKKEGKLIKNQLKKKDFIAALDADGTMFDSPEFARFIQEKMLFFPGNLIFIIGSHAGLCQTLDHTIDFKISFSRLTFPHDLFRVIFLEQLYRALTIIKGMNYHK